MKVLAHRKTLGCLVTIAHHHHHNNERLIIPFMAGKWAHDLCIIVYLNVGRRRLVTEYGYDNGFL